MQHRNSVRLSALERVLHQARQDTIDRIVEFMCAHLTEAEYSAFCAALERNIADGAKAVYTEAELAAAWRFDELANAHPGILKLVKELVEPRYRRVQN